MTSQLMLWILKVRFFIITVIIIIIIIINILWMSLEMNQNTNDARAHNCSLYEK